VVGMRSCATGVERPKNVAAPMNVVGLPSCATGVERLERVICGYRALSRNWCWKVLSGDELDVARLGPIF
jgi:hypothetical protein